MHLKKIQATQEVINYVFATPAIYSTSVSKQGRRNKNYYTAINTVHSWERTVPLKE